MMMTMVFTALGRVSPLAKRLLGTYRPLPLRLLCLLSLASLHAQAIPAIEQQQRQSLILAEQVVLPGYRQLAQRNHILQQSWQAFCGGQQSLSQLQQDLRLSLQAWGYLQAINWGPVEHQHRYTALYFWPDKKDIASRQLRSLLNNEDPAALQPDYFAEASVAVSGLSALERLAFADPALTPNSYACQLGLAISHNTLNISQALLTEWPAYLARWQQDPALGIRLLVKSLHESVQVMYQLKLAQPLGSSAERARLSRAEAWRSQASLNMLTANLQLLEALWGNQQQGIASLLYGPGGDVELALLVSSQLQLIRQQVDSLTLPFATLLQDRQGRAQLLMLSANLESLQNQLAEYVSAALGIILGFNSRDGD